MAKGKEPAFWWYYKDWLSDGQLGRCSLATRAIWIDWLCYMWDAPERGVLRDCTVDGLRSMTRGGTIEQVSAAVQDLLATGTADGWIDDQVVTEDGLCLRRDLLDVTLRHKKVTLLNRRMVRNEKDRKSSARRQQRFRQKTPAPYNGKSNGDVTPGIPSCISSLQLPRQLPRESREQGEKPGRQMEVEFDPERLRQIHGQVAVEAGEIAVEFGVRVKDQRQADQNRRNLELALRDVFCRDGLAACQIAASDFAVIWREKCKAWSAGESIDPQHTTWAQWRTKWNVWPQKVAAQ